MCWYLTVSTISASPAEFCRYPARFVLQLAVQIEWSRSGAISVHVLERTTMTSVACFPASVSSVGSPAECSRLERKALTESELLDVTHCKIASHPSVDAGSRK